MNEWLFAAFIRAGGGFALRRDSGGRWKLDLQRVPIDHVEKRVRKNPNKYLPALASEHRRCRIRMAKLAKLACLAPDILTMILNGKQPVILTPRRLLNAGLPLGWDE
jgi:Protein of unknown function (DUF5818)